MPDAAGNQAASATANTNPNPDGDELNGPIEGLDDEGEPQGAAKRIQELTEQREKDRREFDRQLGVLQQQNANLQKQLGALIERLDGGGQGGGNGQNAPATGSLPAPPQELGQLEKAYWTVNEGVKRFLPDALKAIGIDVDALVKHSGSLPTLAASTVHSEWDRLCEQQGVDSKNPIVRAAFIQLQGEGKQPAEAMKVIKESLPKQDAQPGADPNNPQPQPQPRPGTPMTTSAQTGPTVKKVIVRDAEHAGKLAADGIVAPELGIFDSLKQQEKLRSGS